MEQKLIQYTKDCEWAFGLNRVMLNLLGVWPNDYGSVYLKNVRTPIVLLWILLGYFLPQLYALVKVYPNMTLIIDNIITSCACPLIMAKLFFIWHNRQDPMQIISFSIPKRIVGIAQSQNHHRILAIEPLIHWMTSDWTIEKSSRERALMLKQAHRGRLFTISGYAIMTSSIFSFTLTPFLGLNIRLVNNITDADERRYFPLQTYYPYDFVASPNFELTYVAQLVALVFGGMSFSVADNFFGVLVFHAAGQCEILSVKLAGLFADVGPDADVTFRTKLRWIIDKHVYLARFVNEIEKTFNILILAHTLCLSVSMCCVGFGVISFYANESASPPIIQIAMLSMSLLNMMLHMLVYCTATEILTSNSEEFIRAIYNTNWFLFSAEYSRDIVPLMMRSQRPLRLTAGKFFYVSLNLYAKILKTSAGFISMLLAVS